MLTLKQLGNLFQNISISFCNIVQGTGNIFYVELVKYNKSLVSTVDTDDLVLKHQGISSHGTQ